MASQRQRCTECREWFTPAVSAAATQRACSEACRGRRRRTLHEPGGGSRWITIAWMSGCGSRRSASVAPRRKRAHRAAPRSVPASPTRLDPTRSARHPRCRPRPDQEPRRRAHGGQYALQPHRPPSHSRIHRRQLQHQAQRLGPLPRWRHARRCDPRSPRDARHPHRHRRAQLPPACRHGPRQGSRYHPAQRPARRLSCPAPRIGLASLHSP
jgi:hypothetical protein